MGIFSFLFNKKSKLKENERLVEQENQSEKNRQEELFKKNAYTKTIDAEIDVEENEDKHRVVELIQQEDVDKQKQQNGQKQTNTLDIEVEELSFLEENNTQDENEFLVEEWMINLKGQLENIESHQNNIEPKNIINLFNEPTEINQSSIYGITNQIESDKKSDELNSNRNIKQEEAKKIQNITDNANNIKLSPDRLRKIEEKVTKLNLRTDKEKQEWRSIFTSHETRMEELSLRRKEVVNNEGFLHIQIEKDQKKLSEEQKLEEVKSKEKLEWIKREVEEYKKREEIRKQEENEKQPLLQEEIVKLAGLKRHEEQVKQAELKRQIELAKQAKQAKQAELNRQIKLADQAKQTELQRRMKNAQERQAELKRQEEIEEQLKQAGLQRRIEIAEQVSQVELKRHKELAKNKKREVLIEELFYDSDDDSTGLEYLFEFELIPVGIVKYLNSMERYRDNDLYGDTNSYDFIIPIEELDDFYRYPYIYYPDFEIDSEDSYLSYLEKLDEEEYSQDKEYTGYIRDKIDEYYEYYEKNDFDYEM